MPAIDAFVMNDRTIHPGERAEVALPVPHLPAGPEATMPLVVLHGVHSGPTVWLNAAIHGDELNGIEIIRQVLGRLDVRSLGGTLIAAPIVNLFGVTNESRYLPDRRDLNRHFPGSRKGSLASRLAHTFMTTVVSRCSAGIDLHTGSDHRFNLPQVRAALDDPETRRLATAFGAPVSIASKKRPGSLRVAAANRYDATVLVFEGGVSLRFDASIIDAGTTGVLRVLGALGMIEPSTDPIPRSLVPHRTGWIRAPRAGFFRTHVEVGDEVDKGAVLGEIHDSLGTSHRDVRAPQAGVVIGQLLNPIVYQGDAVVHLAHLADATWLDPSADAER